MEKEINLSVNNINLNYFAESELGERLESLLRKSLKVFSSKSEVILKEKFESLEVNLNVIDDEEIQKINAEYRGKDKATDVLSFPLQENVRRGEFDQFEGHLELGDIFIATGVCEKQALENNLTFDEEFVHLFVHGLLHLSGYDHEESEEEEKIMGQLESEIMDELAGQS
ncbi:MAG: rRNA maturation RNase YbeY [Halobacteriovoraceae bacterium]|nr:rRNA maturation RNase YbeY [Halobacteriovoraceae bacterium]|tara:strand:+ start:7130 stop:7639 length:510 start_codon:yes stop_codon:yes gene_type:complete